jgi:hypothetical protein
VPLHPHGDEAQRAPTSQVEATRLPTLALRARDVERGWHRRLDRCLGRELDPQPGLDQLQVVLGVFRHGEGAPRVFAKKCSIERHAAPEQAAREPQRALPERTDVIDERVPGIPSRRCMRLLGVGHEVRRLHRARAGRQTCRDRVDEVRRDRAVGVHDRHRLHVLRDPLEGPGQRVALPQQVGVHALPHRRSGGPGSLRGRVRAVVGDDDREVGPGRGERGDGGRDARLLVVRGHDDRHPRQPAVVLRRRPASHREGRREQAEEVGVRYRRQRGQSPHRRALARKRSASLRASRVPS